jgi:hypothetical protein
MATTYTGRAKKGDTTKPTPYSNIADKAEKLPYELETNTFSYRFVLEQTKPIENYIGLRRRREAIRVLNRGESLGSNQNP